MAGFDANSVFERTARDLMLHLRSKYRNTRHIEWRNLDDILQDGRFKGGDRDLFIDIICGSRWRGDNRFRVFWQRIGPNPTNRIEYWFCLNDHLLTNHHGD